MGRIDETLQRATARVRGALPSCFSLGGVELAFGFAERDVFVVDVRYRRCNAHLEPWGWEGGLVRELRTLFPREVWIGLREEPAPAARDTERGEGREAV